MPDKGISIRWNGDLQTTLAGDYQLLLRGRGGFRLKLGGESVIDSWTPPPGQEGEERRVSVTRRLPDNAVLPLYPFGHGLGYTSFGYANLRVKPAAEGAVTLTVDVTNTGKRDGDEVVQLYATPPAVFRPRERRALCGFDRVHLKAGETKTLNLIVPVSALRRWSTEKKAYVVPSGRWTIGAGASSSDIRQSTTIDLPL